MKFLQAVVLGVCLAGVSVASAQPAPIAESFTRHRSVLSCPGASSTHAYEACAFEFMRRVACDHQADVALWPKSGGTFCTYNGRGYDCDKLVVLASGEMFDVVGSAGLASQSPTWNQVASGVFGGTVPAPACEAAPPSIETIDLSEAAGQILATFDATHDRQPDGIETQALIAAARALGWDGGPRIPKSAVDTLLLHIKRYSGDITNPFPVVIELEVQRQFNDAFLLRFGRYPRVAELNALDAQASLRGHTNGPMPQWILTELLALIQQYDGSYGSHLSRPVVDAELSVQGKDFLLGSEPFHWRGITAFLLFYDYIHAPQQYRAFRDAAAWQKVNVVRVSVATSTGYLTLEPRSGGTFGLGRTAPLYPGSIPDFWPHYREMLADLAQHGILAEVVPFLTAGPHDSVPQMHSAATRMAYLEEVARELLPIRAAFVEIANEYNFIGFHPNGLEIVGLRERYKQIDPTRLVALSAPSGPGDTVNAQLMAGGDYITVHADRRTEPWSFAWVIRQFGLPQLAYGKPVINDEGINADNVGEFGVDPTPANHFINGVTTRIIGMSYTFHFDRALKGLGPSTGDGSQQAIEAWKMGQDLEINLSGEPFYLTSVAGAVAAAGRLGPANGVVVFYGTSPTFTPPTYPGWSFALLADVGLHKVYGISSQ